MVCKRRMERVMEGIKVFMSNYVFVLDLALFMQRNEHRTLGEMTKLMEKVNDVNNLTIDEINILAKFMDMSSQGFFDEYCVIVECSKGVL